jgi:UDP-N-acetylmuramyl pentapeptide phosphotransferase/UDP-N-acetylglucosamine-1-phosphate transferase
MISDIIIPMAAFLGALIFSPLLANIARQKGIVSGSNGVRWSTDAKPLSGGVSILLAVLASLLMRI